VLIAKQLHLKLSIKAVSDCKQVVAVGDCFLSIAASAAYGLTLAATNMVVQKMQDFTAQANKKTSRYKRWLCQNACNDLKK
jgi:hypothetical protein